MASTTSPVVQNPELLRQKQDMFAALGLSEDATPEEALAAYEKFKAGGVGTRADRLTPEAIAERGKALPKAVNQRRTLQPLVLAAALSSRPEMQRFGTVLEAQQEANDPMKMGTTGVYNQDTGEWVENPIEMARVQAQLGQREDQGVLKEALGLVRGNADNTNDMMRIVMQGLQGMNLQGLRGNQAEDLAHIKGQYGQKLARIRGAWAARKGIEPGKLNNQGVKQLTEGGEALREIATLKSEFKPEYGSFLKEQGFQNWIANKMPMGSIVPQEWKDAATWWQKVNRFGSEYKKRYELFGATLTGNEKTSWDQISISPDLGPNEVARRLNDLESVSKRGMDTLGAGRLAERVSPDMIAGFAGLENLEGMGPLTKTQLGKYTAEQAAQNAEFEAMMADMEAGRGVPMGNAPGGGGKPADWTQEEWDALTPEEQAKF